MALLQLEDRRRFLQLIHRELDLTAFFDAADRAMGRLVTFDAACWLSVDPATLLPTSHFNRELGSAHLPAIAANEIRGHDVNHFAVLARAARPVGVLSEATGGLPDRSPRHADILAPLGFGQGDELRVVFRSGDSVWGYAALHRRHGWFERPEADRVADVTTTIGEGIRRALLTTALTAEDAPDAPGAIVLRADDSVASMTPAARRWLDEIVDPTGGPQGLPLVVVTAAHRARRIAAGSEESTATVRIPRRSGGWLLLHASTLEGESHDEVSVVLSPAREPAIAGLIVEAYGLSVREREVTRLVLHGLSTRELAEELHVSAYTVQDHLKSIFAKVGVRSRRELMARLFLHHYAPKLENGSPIGADGWFTSGDRRGRLAAR